MPWWWPLTDRRLWRFAVLAAPLAVGRSDVRRLQRLYLDASFVDRRLVPMVRIEPGDRRRPPPRRARWQASVHKVDLRPQLGQTTVPTLVCVGRYDPQTPWPANADITAALPAGRLEVFERSGHYPFVEEPERFTTVVATCARCSRSADGPVGVGPSGSGLSCAPEPSWRRDLGWGPVRGDGTSD